MAGINSVNASLNKLDETPFLTVSAVRELVEDKKLRSLWLLNTSASVVRGGKTAPGNKTKTTSAGGGGSLMMVIGNGATGETSEVFTMPLTHVPVEVSGMTDIKRLVQSQGFANYVNRGFLKIVKTEVAEKLYANNPDMYDALEEALNYRVNRQERAANRDDNEDLTEGVHISVVSIMESHDTDSRKLSQLQNISNYIGPAEARYIMATANDSESLKQYASSFLG